MSEREIRTDLPRTKFPSGWEGNSRIATVDIVTLNKSGTHVLLVFRAPGEEEGSKWAFAGGYLDPDNTVEETAEHETRDESKQRLGSLALFRVVDNPNRRNEKNQNVSFVLINKIDDPESYGEIEVQDPDGGIQKAQWFDLTSLPPKEQMAFDHHKILTEYIADPSSTYPMSIFMSD